jgi:DNA invertase Pin-like site-specific DNA recombinase
LQPATPRVAPYSALPRTKIGVTWLLRSAAPLAPGKEATNGEMVFSAAYLRVSTTQQDWKLQRSAVTRAAGARGDRIPKRLWFEEKQSGRTIDRPVLQKLRAAVRAGKVGRLYVFRIDRLTRSGIRDTLGLVEEFRRGGAELVTVADGFDLAGPGAEIVLAVMAWAAQMERSAIGERIKAARVRVEASGGRWGRPRRIDPTTLAKARELVRKNKSVRAIAVALKVPRSTLSDALAGKGHYAK